MIIKDAPKFAFM